MNVHTSRSAPRAQSFTVLPGHLIWIAVDPRASLGNLARDRIAVCHARQMRPHRVAALVNAVQRDKHGNAEWIEVMMVGLMSHVQSGEPLLVLEHDLVVFPLQRHILRIHAIHCTAPPPAPLRRKLATARFLAWAQALAPAIDPLNTSSSSVDRLKEQAISPAKLMEACARAHQQAMDMELVDRREDWDSADRGAEPRVHVWFGGEVDSLADPMKLLDDLEELYVIELVKHERDEQAALSSPSESPIGSVLVIENISRSNRSSSFRARFAQSTSRRFLKLMQKRCGLQFGSAALQPTEPQFELLNGPFDSGVCLEPSERFGDAARLHLARHFTPTRLEWIADSDQDRETFRFARAQQPAPAAVVFNIIRRGGRLVARKVVWWSK